MKKIVIELTKSNKVRKVYTNVPIDCAREAVSNVSAHPSKLKYSRRYRAGRMLKGLKSRFGFILSAIKTAFRSDFPKHDINRHQYEVEL